MDIFILWRNIQNVHFRISLRETPISADSAAIGRLKIDKKCQPLMFIELWLAEIKS